MLWRTICSMSNQSSSSWRGTSFHGFSTRTVSTKLQSASSSPQTRGRPQGLWRRCFPVLRSKGRGREARRWAFPTASQTSLLRSRWGRRRRGRGQWSASTRRLRRRQTATRGHSPTTAIYERAGKWDLSRGENSKKYVWGLRQRVTICLTPSRTFAFSWF